MRYVVSQKILRYIEDNFFVYIQKHFVIEIFVFQETVVYPKVAKNKEDKWLYVVNQDHFVQGVRIETCL